MKSCSECSGKYEIEDQDKIFYSKLGVLEPELCPTCRTRNRMAFRNEKTLHKRKCDLCNKGIISIYSEDKPFKVYCQECYWSDKWDAGAYGLKYQNDEPFLDQFAVLLRTVPRLAIVNKQSQNSDYCNYSFANKNCYLTFGNHYEEDCMYGRYATKNKDCYDYLWLYHSELCYECLFCKNCYECVFLDHSENCKNCLFSFDLKGCSYCFFCANLRHKEYHILNQPYSKEEYFEIVNSYKLESYAGLERARSFFLTEFREEFPFRALYQVNCEDCEGSNHENCKNLRESFDCTNCEDISYGCQIDETYSSQDMTCMGYDRSELCFQTIGCSGIFNCVACDSCWHGSDLSYCNLCFSSNNCLGCISLQQKSYCILNSQYSESEYHSLRDKIIKDMKEAGSWGKFFPVNLSPFAYNETVAQEFLPLSEKVVKSRFLKWKEKESRDYLPQKIQFPETADQINEGFCKELLSCEECGKNYKIQKPELSFYQKLDLPIPRLCSDCRNLARIQRRDQRRLYPATCEKCSQKIQSIYSPNGPEKVYCEKCYLENLG